MEDIHPDLWLILLKRITDEDCSDLPCRCDACTVKAFCDNLVYSPRKVVNVLRTHLIALDTKYWH